MIDVNRLIELGIKAKNAARELYRLSSGTKNDALKRCAEMLISEKKNILESNSKDLTAASADYKASFIDRLRLDEKRVEAMADGLLQIAMLNDPLNDYVGTHINKDGLTISQKRVPIGVIGIIYEARPNVTSDAFGLCLKSGNAVLLKGGKEAINSNISIVDALHKGLRLSGLSENFIQLIEDTSRETTMQMMRLNSSIDVLIPRGSAGLIKAVVENATIPVIETGVGNCHIYVDMYADLKKATDIIINAKVQRPGVCNACETLIVHSAVAAEYIPVICGELSKYGVELRGDMRTRELAPDIAIVEASDDDYYTEYNDLIIAVAVVDSIDEAISHISKYSSKHSDAILSENYTNVQKFLNEIDSAAVYANASTRFTDGCEFGFGAEIGISTSKLHARGPMGLKELTTTKYVIYGSGQIRK